MALTDKLTAIADAIREKTGSTDSMTLDEMAANIGEISGEGETVTTDSADALVDKSITEYSSDTLTSIGQHTFYYCTNLTSVDTPNVTSVEDYAFSNCLSLTNVDAPNVTSIGNSAFYGCSKLQTISIPNVTIISISGFRECSALTMIDLSNATSIGEYGFYKCTSLATADTSNVTSIGSQAFYSCPLTFFDLSSCTKLGERAFRYCEDLKKVWLPSTCTTVSASGYTYSPFYNASSECEIYTDVTDEDSIPSGWGTYWNYYASGSTLTVHYGATHDEYEAA